MFTSRFLKLPAIMDRVKDEAIVSDIRINPFTIEAYYADIFSYPGEGGIIQDSECVHLLTRNDEFWIAISMEEFEKILNQI